METLLNMNESKSQLIKALKKATAEALESGMDVTAVLGCFEYVQLGLASVAFKLMLDDDKNED